MDAVTLVVDYLNACDLGATAYPAVPSDRPDTLCAVELTGGRQTGPVAFSPSVDIDCWAPTRPEAEALASRVRRAMLAMPERSPNVFHVEIDSLYDNRDPDSGSPRYTVGCDITAAE